MGAKKKGRVIVVMGIAGCGKSRLGRDLAETLQCPFVEGDDEHPSANIDKMSRGEALNDKDREQWLQKLKARVENHLGFESAEDLILTCSALKKSYRDILRSAKKPEGCHILFCHLAVDLETVEERLRDRQEHFFPSSLLKSQLDDLEAPPSGAEDASLIKTIDGNGSYEEVNEAALEWLKSL